MSPALWVAHFSPDCWRLGVSWRASSCCNAWSIHMQLCSSFDDSSWISWTNFPE